MGWMTESDQVHVDALFCDVEEMEHEEQVFLAVLAYADQAAVGCQLLEFTEMAEEVVDSRNVQG
jgi:hypothetical protein